MFAQSGVPGKNKGPGVQDCDVEKSLQRVSLLGQLCGHIYHIYSVHSKQRTINLDIKGITSYENSAGKWQWSKINHEVDEQQKKPVIITVPYVNSVGGTLV